MSPHGVKTHKPMSRARDIVRLPTAVCGVFCLSLTLAQAEIPVEGGDSDPTNKPAVVVPPPRHTSKPRDVPPEKEPSSTRDEAVRLTIELDEGSRLIGTTMIEKLLLKTSYAQIEVPLRMIGEIAFNKEDASVAVRLQNGDSLKGALNLQTLKLKTSFGEVSVPMDHTVRILVAQASSPK